MRRDNDWKLGIVKSFFAMDAVPHANIFIWLGSLDILGTPKFGTVLGLKKWTDIKHYFHLEKLEVEEIELLLVNQVHGIPIGNKAPLYIYLDCSCWRHAEV